VLPERPERVVFEMLTPDLGELAGRPAPFPDDLVVQMFGLDAERLATQGPLPQPRRWPAGEVPVGGARQAAGRELSHGRRARAPRSRSPLRGFLVRRLGAAGLRQGAPPRWSVLGRGSRAGAARTAPAAFMRRRLAREGILRRSRRRRRRARRCRTPNSPHVQIPLGPPNLLY